MDGQRLRTVPTMFAPAVRIFARERMCSLLDDRYPRSMERYPRQKEYRKMVGNTLHSFWYQEMRLLILIIFFSNKSHRTMVTMFQDDQTFEGCDWPMTTKKRLPIVIGICPFLEMYSKEFHVICTFPQTHSKSFTVQLGSEMSIVLIGAVRTRRPRVTK
jgi:hypothetical protein